MTLAQIAVLIGLAVLLGRLRNGRGLALLGVSTAILFWLQPAEPLRTLGFWLPIATLGLTVVTWLLTHEAEKRRWSENWQAAAVMATVVGLAALLSSTESPLGLAFARPGVPLMVSGLLVGIGTVAALWRLKGNFPWLLAVLHPEASGPNRAVESRPRPTSQTTICDSWLCIHPGGFGYSP